MYDVIIVGGGPAGLTAGIYSSRYGLKTLVIDEGGCEGQISLSPEVENIPGFDSIAGIDFMSNLRRQAEELGVEILDYTKVLKIKKNVFGDNLWKIKTDSVCEEAKEYTTTAVIACTGCKHRTLNLPGEKELIGNGVHFCATCDGPFYKDKDVIVVGGGNSAMVEVQELAKICKTVTILQNLPELTADKTTVDRILALDNVKVKYNSIVTDYFILNEKLSGVWVQCKDDPEYSELINANGVFLAIGMEPNTGIIGIDSIQAYVSADREKRMAENGLFVAGDIKEKELRQVVTACSDGAIAAQRAMNYVKKSE